MKLTHKNYSFIIYILGIVFIYSCKDKREQTHIERPYNDNFYFLDFEKELENLNYEIDTITINSIAKNIEFVNFEATERSLLSDLNLMVAESDDDYYVSSGMFHTSSGVLRFDLHGKFKESLIEKGQGPLELPYLNFWSMNDSLNLVSMFGSAIKTISYNTHNYTKHSFLLESYGGHPIQLNDSTYVAYTSVFPAMDNDVPYFVFFDSNGEIVHSLHYPQGHNVGYEVSQDHPQGLIYEGYGIFKDHKNNALLKDVFNDTIYKAKSKDEILPYICTYRGKMTPQHRFVTDINRQASVIYIHHLAETENYIFTSYLYNKTKQTAIWDKRSRNIIARVVNTDQRSREFIRYRQIVKYRTPKGNIVFLNMIYTKENVIYCMLRVEDAMEFLPNVNSDSNPILVKFYV
ncbi:6-bladed beta-propeller [Bacteroides sp. 224]|uniref:6-bladed beta-propeller n=1 Tax=Bacteroides sp. 224 TaxID=2302936 RepID=UPI0013D813F8|nr:6-bladed beta-propeller [Bacteroides sp. 224]